MAKAALVRAQSTMYAVAMGTQPMPDNLAQMTGDSNRVYNTGNYMNIVEVCVFW